MDKGETPAVHAVHFLEKVKGFNGWWDTIDNKTKNAIIEEMNIAIADCISRDIKNPT